MRITKQTDARRIVCVRACGSVRDLRLVFVFSLMQTPCRSTELLSMSGVSAVGSLRSASRTSSAASLAATRRSRSPSPISQYGLRQSAPPAVRSVTPGVVPSPTNNAPCFGGASASAISSPAGPELQCPRPRWPVAFSAAAWCNSGSWQTSSTGGNAFGVSGLYINGVEEANALESEAVTAQAAVRPGGRWSAGVTRGSVVSGRPSGFGGGSGGGGGGSSSSSSAALILQRSSSSQSVHSLTPPPPPLGSTCSSPLSSSPTIGAGMQTEWRAWHPTFRIDETVECATEPLCVRPVAIRRANSYTAPSPGHHGVAIPSPLAGAHGMAPFLSSGYATPNKVGECGVSPPVRATNPQCRDARFCVP